MKTNKANEMYEQGILPKRLRDGRISLAYLATRGEIAFSPNDQVPQIGGCLDYYGLHGGKFFGDVVAIDNDKIKIRDSHTFKIVTMKIVAFTTELVGNKHV